MNRITVALAAAAAFAATQAHAAPTVIFDDFESYGAVSQPNFTGFAQATVTAGSVSYVDTSDSGLTTPYGHGMVDTDGSAEDPGVFRTPELALEAGSKLRWELDASGNQRSGSDGRRMGFVSATTPYELADLWYDFGAGPVAFGSFSSPAGKSFFFNLPVFASDKPWGHYAIGGTLVNAATVGAFIADPLGATSGDDKGVLIDNIRYTAGVPEPASWALMIGGFGMAGTMLRRRRLASVRA